MNNKIDVLLGEPYTGKTKFQVGDVLKDAMFPSRERLKVLSIEVQQLNPWHTCVVYELESNLEGKCSGLQEIIESEGRFVVESTCENARKIWNMLVERVKNGKLTKLD